MLGLSAGEANETIALERGKPFETQQLLFNIITSLIDTCDLVYTFELRVL